MRLFVLLALLLTSACLLTAAGWEGILIDKHCSARVLREGQDAARAHTRDCALMPDCVKSGFGVVTADGKFIAFDAEGSQKAEKALRDSKKNDNLRVKVSGELSGNVIKVASLKLL